MGRSAPGIGSGVYAGGASKRPDESSGFLTERPFLCREEVESLASLANDPVPGGGVTGGDDDEELEVDGERGGIKIS